MTPAFSNNEKVTKPLGATIAWGVLSILALSGPPMKAWSAAGTSGGNILSIPVGARAIGMGEAYTGDAKDSATKNMGPMESSPPPRTITVRSQR